MKHKYLYQNSDISLELFDKYNKQTIYFQLKQNNTSNETIHVLTRETTNKQKNINKNSSFHEKKTIKFGCFYINAFVNRLPHFLF